MRLWSLHPRYLDSIGLVALWREGLLAQKVLLGKTKGYTKHPQLERFRSCSDPVRAVGCYLKEVWKEADRRGYCFDGSKIVKPGTCGKIKLRKGQLRYEWAHLQKKLKLRNRKTYIVNKAISRPKAHPLFTITPGKIEDWERI